MNFFILVALFFVAVWPFIWLIHALSYDMARERVKKMGRKGDYSYTVKHKWHGWVLARKSV